MDWKTVELPCGQCIGCRLEYSAQWAMRCILEAKQWKHNHFVTLTYDENHVPSMLDTNSEGNLIHKKLLDKEYKVFPDTGELVELQTLHKPDLQKFMKDLRAHYRYDYKHTGIRFYRCGEYGEETQRPHYHLILFNLPVFDLRPYFINKQHEQIYISDYLQKIWGKGIVTVGEVTYQSRAYVARYIMKKQTGKNKSYIREPEFTEMSTRPGIGKDYFDKHAAEIYKNDEIVFRARLDAAVRKKPPRYFDKLYDQIEPDKLSDIKKERRTRAQENRDRKQLHTTLSPMQQLKVAERNMIAKSNTLKRSLKEEV